MDAVVGQNVSLPCTLKSSSALKIVSIEWMKNNKDTKVAVYSPDEGFNRFWPNVTMQIENASMGSHLQLYGVTTQDSGIYICSISSFPQGSTWRETVLQIKDLVTVPPQSNVTEEGLIESADSGLTTSPTTGLSTTDANVAWTINMSTDLKDDNPNSRNTTAEEHKTSLTNSTHVSVTLSPVTHTDPNPFSNSTDQEIHPTHNFNTSVASNLSTTSSNDIKVFRSTYGTKNESMGSNPDAAPTLSTGNTTIVIEDEGDTFDTGTGGAQSHLLWLIIIPILVLIAAAGFLYLRIKRKERMNLPPPFKPPPPPVKYTAATRHGISTQPFPTSRCNSVT